MFSYWPSNGSRFQILVIFVLTAAPNNLHHSKGWTKTVSLDPDCLLHYHSIKFSHDFSLVLKLLCILNSRLASDEYDVPCFQHSGNGGKTNASEWPLLYFFSFYKMSPSLVRSLAQLGCNLSPISLYEANQIKSPSLVQGVHATY